MSFVADQVRERCFAILDEWLESCTRRGKLARNTIAVGIVVLDQLRRKCPVSREEVISEGGEVRGSRGAALRGTLEKYGIARRYLKEVTTRQGHQDGQRLFEALEWGGVLMALADKVDRDALLADLIEHLAARARAWLDRSSLKLDLDQRDAPSTWIHRILEGAKGRSGGVVEQHLVGAKLRRRFPDVPIPNYPAHAADAQTDRPGDFAIGSTVFHVTAAPGMSVVERCAENVRRGQHPVLLVPRDAQSRATALAEVKEICAQVSVISIEDFLALNIIESATAEQVDLFRILQEILEIYNRRLRDVETDMSLRIEVR